MQINHWLLSHSRITHSLGGLGWWCTQIIMAIIIINQQNVIHCHAFSTVEQQNFNISVLCLKGDWRSKTNGRFPVITYFISSNKWYIRIKLSSSTPVSHIQYICYSSPENGHKINFYHQDLYIVFLLKYSLVCDLRQELIIHIWKWYREISKYVPCWNSKEIANTNFPCQYLIIFESMKR